jgi:hypothetical protein
MASHCVGFTLPGMIEDPGSFSGRINSPMPQRGPDASQRMSFATFIRARKPACAATIESSDACASNLFGAVINGKPVSFAISVAISSLKFGGAFRPVPTAVPPAAS